MKQEFVTLYGKAIVEKNTLYIRNLNVPFSRTAFAKIALELSFAAVFILQFFRDSYPLYYVSIIVWGVMLALRIPGLFDLLFKRGYSNRIPLQNIKSVDIDHSADGLHTHVNLHLISGRFRKIIFRKLEDQHDASQKLFQFILRGRSWHNRLFIPGTIS